MGKQAAGRSDLSRRGDSQQHNEESSGDTKKFSTNRDYAVGGIDQGTTPARDNIVEPPHSSDGQKIDLTIAQASRLSPESGKREEEVISPHSDSDGGQSSGGISGAVRNIFGRMLASSMDHSSQELNEKSSVLSQEIPVLSEKYPDTSVAEGSGSTGSTSTIYESLKAMSSTFYRTVADMMSSSSKTEEALSEKQTFDEKDISSRRVQFVCELAEEIKRKEVLIDTTVRRFTESPREWVEISLRQLDSHVDLVNAYEHLQMERSHPSFKQQDHQSLAEVDQFLLRKASAVAVLSDKAREFSLSVLTFKKDVERRDKALQSSSSEGMLTRIDQGKALLDDYKALELAMEKARALHVQEKLPKGHPVIASLDQSLNGLEQEQVRRKALEGKLAQDAVVMKERVLTESHPWGEYSTYRLALQNVHEKFSQEIDKNMSGMWPSELFGSVKFMNECVTAFDSHLTRFEQSSGKQSVQDRSEGPRKNKSSDLVSVDYVMRARYEEMRTGLSDRFSAISQELLARSAQMESEIQYIHTKFKESSINLSEFEQRYDDLRNSMAAMVSQKFDEKNMGPSYSQHMEGLRKARIDLLRAVFPRISEMRTPIHRLRQAKQGS